MKPIRNTLTPAIRYKLMLQDPKNALGPDVIDAIWSSVQNKVDCEVLPHVWVHAYNHMFEQTAGK